MIEYLGVSLVGAVVWVALVSVLCVFGALLGVSSWPLVASSGGVLTVDAVVLGAVTVVAEVEAKAHDPIKTAARLSTLIW